MTFKEVTALVQLASAVLVGIWLAVDTTGNAAATTTAEAATRLLWAVAAVIAFNIVATVVVTIVASIVQREVVRDEAADERDRAVIDRSMRNSGIVQSVAATAGLFVLAFGGDPVLGAYALFAAAFLGGAVEAVSRLVYYRLG